MWYLRFGGFALLAIVSAIVFLTLFVEQMKVDMAMTEEAEEPTRPSYSHVGGGLLQQGAGGAEGTVTVPMPCSCDVCNDTDESVEQESSVTTSSLAMSTPAPTAVERPVDPWTATWPTMGNVYAAYFGEASERMASINWTLTGAVAQAVQPVPAVRPTTRAIVLVCFYSTGTSILQEFVQLHTPFNHVRWTPMNEFELDFFGRAGVALGLPQLPHQGTAWRVEPTSTLPAAKLKRRQDSVAQLSTLLMQNGRKFDAIHSQPAAWSFAQSFESKALTAIRSQRQADLFVLVRDAFCTLVNIVGGRFFEKTPHYIFRPSSLALLFAVDESIRRLNQAGDESSVCHGLSLSIAALVRHPVSVAMSMHRRWGNDLAVELEKWTFGYRALANLLQDPSLVSPYLLRYEDFVKSSAAALYPLLAANQVFLPMDVAKGPAGTHGAVRPAKSLVASAVERNLAAVPQALVTAATDTATFYGYDVSPPGAG
jgi:hypothetical protein